MDRRPNLTLTLSKDKNTLTTSDHWSYKRVNRVIEDTNADNETRSVLLEYFDVDTRKLILGELTNKSIIVTQKTNTETDQLATITIKLTNGTQEIIKLNPGKLSQKNMMQKKS